ncbi:acetyl-CoA carboxylase biotin carboxylase subunit [Pseudomonas aeruginosa]|uniref:acetyl-CoA carboxylase biotin carboxylase subunit n=1 Tax=Pseudomonas aeruginosa TaxID=287 RepID=UPI0011A1F560|nr:acetyl-CoA carboxylase biotin carboxylase subunit [Pseudomonas aeruginosa]
MHKRLNKLLVANRGEIAVRIIRAAQALGIPTVAVCSEADRDSLAARLADEVRLIGPARAERSYLDIEAILMAARETGADSIHPGYGFLSENPAFAEAVQAAGLVFVGPDAQTIRRMGDKAEARRTAMAAGVPVVPGSPGELDDLDAALACAEEVGYPLLVKASAGGGGRGIRIAHDADELRREFPIAQREAQAAFGSPAVHLFERECSLQRRRQKVFEEAPSAALDGAQRQALCESAVRLAQSLGYRGAGTLEYLFDAHSGEFFFIEMNTRIQVEHPVSEMVTGIDLVQAMLRIAAGEALPWRQEDIRLNGAALEMRINAEDPARNFFPSPGTVERLEWPQGEGVRVDSHLYPGYRVPPYYDSLLAKLIVHGRDRDEAFARARQALERTVLAGMATTLPLHRWLLADARVQAAQFDTATLETWLAERTAAAQEV